MPKAKKSIPDINDIEWTDYVLGLLSDDEKIAGNPTTDGLRRVFEIAMDCTVVESSSSVVQTPEPSCRHELQRQWTPGGRECVGGATVAIGDTVIQTPLSTFCMLNR